ncbi:MAG TPA: OmpA family protein, partial [Kofleriaceae bacterium]|nr:OmpA family protein [Kofleriaceae bacterium]
MPRPLVTFRAVVVAALAALAVPACDHVERSNSDPARERWSKEGDDIRVRATDLRTREQALAGRINALAVPAGTEDAGLADTIAQLKTRLDPMDQACLAVEQALTRVTGEVELALSKPDKLAAKRTVDTGLATFDAAADTAKSVLDDVTPQVATAEALMQRLADGAKAEQKRFDTLATSGGSLELSEIDFKPGTADLDLSHADGKATLDHLVAFAGACDGLRFSITGHTSREGKPAANKALSLARADAVKAYLTTAGVAPAKISATAGVGGNQPLVDEPEPGTPEEAAMPPGELAARRDKNERISVKVETPCTAPTAQPPTEPPPGADTAT